MSNCQLKTFWDERLVSERYQGQDTASEFQASEVPRKDQSWMWSDKKSQNSWFWCLKVNFHQPAVLHLTCVYSLTCSIQIENFTVLNYVYPSSLVINTIQIWFFIITKSFMVNSSSLKSNRKYLSFISSQY